MIEYKCPHCGEGLSVPGSMAGQSEKCPACGKSSIAPGAAAAAPAASPPMPPPIPPAPPAGPSVGAGATPRTQGRPKKASGLGIAALVLGIVALLVCWIPLVGLVGVLLSMVGLILGIVGIIAARGGRTGVGLPIAATVISGAALLVVLPVQIGVAIYRHVAQETADVRDQAEASRLYDEAMDLYRQARKADRSAKEEECFNAALDKFRQVFRGYDKTAPSFARRAEVMGYICRAYLDALEGNWSECDKNYGMAVKGNEAFKRDSGELVEFYRPIGQDLRDCKAYMQDSRQFEEAIAKAKEAEANADFEGAEKILSDQAAQYAKQSDRIALIRAMQQTIAEKKKIEEYARQVKKGDELAGKKDVHGAKAAYNKALDVLEQVKNTLPSNAYTEMKQAVEKKIQTMERNAVR